MMQQKAVCVILRNSYGEILCVSRKDNLSDFGLPGGKVDDNETIHEAAVREVREETGLQISSLNEIYSGIEGSYFVTCFIGEWSGNISFSENHIVKWANSNILLNGSFGEYNKAALDAMSRQEGMMHESFI